MRICCPLTEVVGYLKIGGPKLGRDYSDPRLEASLRASLRYLRETWPIRVNAQARGQNKT